jgi:hemerythrin-like domain-containing protein
LNEFPRETRRKFFTTASRLFVAPAIGVGWVLNCTRAESQSQNEQHEETKEPGNSKDQKENGEVTATEDLMREHGILRRTLIVYAEIVPKLHQDPSGINPSILQKAAKLFQTFGEDYHERKLEESYIFPEVKKLGGSVSELADVLLLQHNRGREITQYILRISNSEGLAAKAHELAAVLETFVRMYESHAAREDTVLFPAWKASHSASQLDELAEKFEDIEHKQFGQDGFEFAVKQITEIEEALGIADLSKFTAPAPPAGKG